MKNNTAFDNPWKDIIDSHFMAFMQFFFPVIHQAIDWQQGYEFLDKELARSQRLRWERLIRSSASSIVKQSLTVGIPKLELGNETIPDFLSQNIQNISDSAYLSSLLERAVTVDSIETFQQEIKAQEKI